MYTITIAEIIGAQSYADHLWFVQVEIPFASALLLEVQGFINLWHRRMVHVPGAINANATHTTHNVFGGQCPRHSRSIGIIGIVLVMVFPLSAGHFRGVRCSPTCNAVANEFYQGH